MRFKERVFSDINKVFLNNKFFGEAAEVNGKEANVVIDNDALRERNLALIKDGKLHADDVLFYIRKDFFDSGIPRPEKRMMFNSVDYMITSVKDDMNMLTITLRRYGG